MTGGIAEPPGTQKAKGKRKARPEEPDEAEGAPEGDEENAQEDVAAAGMLSPVTSALSLIGHSVRTCKAQSIFSAQSPDVPQRQDARFYVPSRTPVSTTKQGERSKWNGVSWDTSRPQDPRHQRVPVLPQVSQGSARGSGQSQTQSSVPLLSTPRHPRYAQIGER